MVGDLKIEHHMPPINSIQQYIFGIIPPAGERVRTAVRHYRDLRHGGAITWRRAFYGGESVFESIWTTKGACEPVSEAFGPVHLAQTLELNTDASHEGDDSQQITRATLKHHASWLLGMIPVPLVLLHTTAIMEFEHVDADAYNLTVNVTLLNLPMLTYTGTLRKEDDWEAYLTEKEAQQLYLLKD